MLSNENKSLKEQNEGFSKESATRMQALEKAQVVI